MSVSKPYRLCLPGLGCQSYHSPEGKGSDCYECVKALESVFARVGALELSQP